MVDVKELIKFTNDDVVDFADAFCTEGKIGQGPSILLRDGTVYSLDNHDTHLDFFLALYDYKADLIRDEYAEDEVDYELDMLDDDDFIMDMVERDLGIITLNLGLMRGESRPKIVVLTKPTDAQYEVLREFLERVQSFKKYVVVFIGADSTYKEYRFDDDTGAKDVLNKIKAYFASGNLRESDDEDEFTYSEEDVANMAYADDAEGFGDAISIVLTNGKAYDVDYWDTHSSFFSDVVFGEGAESFSDGSIDYAVDKLGIILLNTGSSIYDDMCKIVIGKKPTEAQYKTLESWLETLYDARDSVTVFVNYDQERFDLNAHTAQDVVKSVKRYFVTGMFESLNEDSYVPKKTGKAYKVFRVKNGKLYPPMVANPGGQDTPIGVWLDAQEGEFACLSKTGRPQVKSTGSGNLAYRPGWHLGDVPRAKQFDRFNKETGEYEFPKDFVWAECDYAMDVDYQPEADEMGYVRTKLDDKGEVQTYKSDKYQHSLAGLKKLPSKGYYKYRTNPNPDTVPWVITGQMRVNRLLSDDEVNDILKSNGIAPIHRQGGDKTLKELGLGESLNEVIVKKGSKWQVQSEKGRNMGTYDTKKEAEKRLKQVHYFKHMNEDNINEEIVRSERFDMLITDNPYEVKNYLKRFEKEGARIFIDERLPLYLVCNVYEATHHDMIDVAIERGYDTKFDDFDEKKVCALYYPKSADVNYLSDIRDDDYDHAYEYADAVVFSRYNDFNAFELSDVLGQHETKEVSEYITDESLNEAKADTERFMKWISDGYKSMKYSDWASDVYAKEAIAVFDKYKNSLKGDQRDIYAWMKKPFSEFASLVSALKKKDDEKAEMSRKEDEGARLVYKDDDWYVYEITTYEASRKYGASTKWCISGSKRWQNGQNGEKFWKEYFDDNGIRFYFFIDRKNGGKYALAAYPDGEHYEIYNDEDIRVPFIPDAPLVNELLDMFGTHEVFYANSDTTKEIEFALASKELPAWFIKYLFDDFGHAFFDGQNVDVFENIHSFVNALDWDIPDGYLEWEAVNDDKMSEEEFAKITGEEYYDEWSGDLPIITNWHEIPEWWLGKSQALRKSNFKSGIYALMPDDSAYQWKIYDNSKELILDASTFFRGNLIAELAKMLMQDVASGNLQPEELADVLGLSEDDLTNLKSVVGSDYRESLNEEILYHGSTQKGIDTFKSPINWVTDDIDYAKYYATSLDDEGSVYTLDVNLGKTLDVGKTGVRAYSIIPIKPYRPTAESFELASKLGLSNDELYKLLRDVCEEFGLENDGYKMMLSTVVRSNAFAKILREKGYDSVSTMEYNVPKKHYSKAYGVLRELKPIDEMPVKYGVDDVEENIEEDIEKHDTLNQKLFDGDELRQDVKDKIIEIANTFVDELATDGVKFDLKDIVLVGSNVSYNYTKDSDLDIHLIADSSNLDCPDELYPLLYSAYRSIFNKNYDIKIKGIPAEVYVEMDEPQGKSNGVYSINDGWVKKPVQTSIPDIDDEKFDGLFSEWEDRYFELVDEIEAELGSTEHPLDESLKRVDK